MPLLKPHMVQNNLVLEYQPPRLFMDVKTLQDINPLVFDTAFSILAFGQV